MRVYTLISESSKSGQTMTSHFSAAGNRSAISMAKTMLYGMRRRVIDDTEVILKDSLGRIIYNSRSRYKTWDARYGE